MPRGRGLVPVRAGTSRRVTRTYGGTSRPGIRAGMTLRPYGYVCPGRFRTGPRAGRHRPARNAAARARKRGVHEHGSAARLLPSAPQQPTASPTPPAEHGSRTVRHSRGRRPAGCGRARVFRRRPGEYDAGRGLDGGFPEAVLGAGHRPGRACHRSCAVGWRCFGAACVGSGGDGRARALRRRSGGGVVADVRGAGHRPGRVC